MRHAYKNGKMRSTEEGKAGLAWLQVVVENSELMIKFSWLCVAASELKTNNFTRLSWLVVVATILIIASLFKG